MMETLIKINSILPMHYCNMLISNSKGYSHHDDDGGHIVLDKKDDFPEIASILENNARKVIDFPIHSIDHKMNLYRLDSKSSPVMRHQDEDFPGLEGTIARYSLLVYLNNSYKGGETVFDGVSETLIETGQGIIFPHSLWHEGLAVKEGVKWVLKTDVFVGV